jgi:hypothetical protein
MKKNMVMSVYQQMKKAESGKSKKPVSKSYQEKNRSWVTITFFDSEKFISDQFIKKKASEVHSYFLIYNKYGLENFIKKLK